MKHEKDAQAFPRSGFSGEVGYGRPTNGMTLRQYAAIKLRVPDSGTEWLDDMIRQSLRDESAAKAMQGILSNGDVIDQFNDKSIEWAVENSIKLADAMIKARGEV